MESSAYIFIFLIPLFLLPATDSHAMRTLADVLGRTNVGTERRDWILLREKVEADAQIPDRQEVLLVMDYHRNDPVRCETLLRRLNGGKAYRYIVAHILPVLYVPVKKSLPALSAAEATPIIYKETGLPLPARLAASARVGREETRPLSEPGTVVAVKNNLLYDVALAPNIEVEIPVGNRWSVNAEYRFPWWLNSKKELCYQLLSGSVEGRCWLGKRQREGRLTGHFLGLYAEGGVYDFQFHTTGYQGDYYVASGFSYGYAKRLARHLSLEFGLGVGYLITRYCRYTSFQERLVRTKAGYYHWVGPAKAKISLVWHLKARR